MLRRKKGLKMRKLDARGMSCPEPVLITKRVVDLGENHIEVMVDSAAAKNNVEKFLTSNGYKITIEEEEEFYTLKGRK